MSSRAFAIFISTLAASTGIGCKPTDAPFVCKADRQCVLGEVHGICQPGGACSFPDGACPGGQRFGKHVPPDLRGQCVLAASCGDGKHGEAEACDDGNQTNDDGCTRVCVLCDASVGDARSPGEDGSCYARINEPLPWHKAQTACQELGGHLVTFAVGENPDSRQLMIAEQAMVEKKLLAGDRARFWIGHSLDPGQGFGEWVTGERMAEGLWHPGSSDERGEPGAGSNCTTMSPGSSPEKAGLTYLWSREDCSNPRPFVCEIPPWIRRPNGRGAFRMVYERMAWGEAGSACAALGAHLSVVEDEGTRDFIVSHFSGAFWIGANDDATEGAFKWTDGSPAKYKDFAPGEPDNLSGGSDCIVVERDKKWHDRSCTTRYRAVCQR